MSSWVNLRKYVICCMENRRLCVSVAHKDFKKHLWALFSYWKCVQNQQMSLAKLRSRKHLGPLGSKCPQVPTESTFTRDTSAFRPLLTVFFIQRVCFFRSLFSASVVSDNNDHNYEEYFLSSHYTLWISKTMVTFYLFSILQCTSEL